jgi:hypothetical protein
MSEFVTRPPPGAEIAIFIFGHGAGLEEAEQTPEREHLYKNVYYHSLFPVPGGSISLGAENVVLQMRSLKNWYKKYGNTESGIELDNKVLREHCRAAFPKPFDLQRNMLDAYCFNKPYHAGFMYPKIKEIFKKYSKNYWAGFGEIIKALKKIGETVPQNKKDVFDNIFNKFETMYYLLKSLDVKWEDIDATEDAELQIAFLTNVVYNLKDLADILPQSYTKNDFYSEDELKLVNDFIQTSKIAFDTTRAEKMKIENVAECSKFRKMLGTKKFRFTNLYKHIMGIYVLHANAAGQKILDGNYDTMFDPGYLEKTGETSKQHLFELQINQIVPKIYQCDIEKPEEGEPVVKNVAAEAVIKKKKCLSGINIKLDDIIKYLKELGFEKIVIYDSGCQGSLQKSTEEIFPAITSSAPRSSSRGRSRSSSRRRSHKSGGRRQTLGGRRRGRARRTRRSVK